MNKPIDLIHGINLYLKANINKYLKFVFHTDYYLSEKKSLSTYLTFSNDVFR